MRKGKPNKKYVAVAIVFLAAAGFAFYKLYPREVRRPKEIQYTWLYEDVANDCGRTADGVVSTTAGREIVEFQVPTDEVDEYLETALDEGRCVARKDNVR